LDIDGHIKLTDFGLSKINFGERDLSDSFCGSPEYMSPEMLLKHQHGRAVDFYSLGALLYEMLVGLPPFYSENREELYDNILNHDMPVFPKFLSSKIKHLLQGLLCKDPKKRLGYKGGVKQIMRHPFLIDVDW
jgi:serine/threonine protein kinase